jgi:preprotein translocase subunit SecD
MRRSLIWSLVLFMLVAVVSFVATILSGNRILLGLDLKGGVSVVLQPEGTANKAQLDEAVTIIENRVNGLGVSNATVDRQGNNVVISLPGIKNSQQALKTLGQTAVLYFRPVYCLAPNYVAPHTATPSTPATTAGSTTATTKAKALPAQGGAIEYKLTSVVISASGATTTTLPQTTTTVPASASRVTQADCSSTNLASIPSTPVTADVADATVLLPQYDHTVRYILGPADMKGDVVHDATVIAPTAGGGFQVQVTFTNSGATQFDKIAAERYPYYQANQSNPPVEAQEAMELDGVVISAPVIQAPAFHGTAVISGSSSAPFTESQASSLANVLKYGSLPVRFVPQSVQTVSASVGQDSLRAGLAAGVGGLLLVMIYMLFYYRALGLVVLAGLGFGGALLYSILALLSQTNSLALTLAGVTGIIVSIGITVDSYVVYFERLKDEVRAGRSVRQSTERSFQRAFRTVVTADTVSFLAALILYLFTVGDVRGFAFTLGLSTLLDVATAFFFIRPAVILVGRQRFFTDNPVFGISRGLGARTAPRTVPAAATRNA